MNTIKNWWEGETIVHGICSITDNGNPCTWRELKEQIDQIPEECLNNNAFMDSSPVLHSSKGKKQAMWNFIFNFITGSIMILFGVCVVYWSITSIASVWSYISK
jgi:hypothetical protein